MVPTREVVIVRVIFFNDTGQDMDTHAGSAKEVAGLKRIPAGLAVEFEVGDTDEVFVKVWPTQVMVRSVNEDALGDISALLSAKPTRVKPSGARVTRVVWRANATDVNGCLLTSNALRQMANDLRIRRPPISFNFDVRKPPVGRVVSARMADDELRVTCDIHDGEVLTALLSSRAALRPGYVMEDAVMRPDGVMIVGSVSGTYLGLTPNPMPLPEEPEEGETQ